MARPAQQGQTASPFRTALYARVSTAHNGQDPEMHLRELREYCQRRDWQLTRELR
jgi:predicted site-specific integrase-resolvase